MNHNQSTAEVIADQLRAGVSPQAVIKLGYSHATVYRVKKRIDAGTPPGGKVPSKQKRAASSGETSAASSTRVRLTQEEITLPGEMFILYELVKTNFPEYQATKSQWLQHVVKTWAIEHAQELRFDFMFPQLFPGNEDDIDDEGDEDADNEGLDALDPLPEGGHDESDGDGQLLSVTGGRGPDEDGETGGGNGL